MKHKNNKIIWQRRSLLTGNTIAPEGYWKLMDQLSEHPTGSPEYTRIQKRLGYMLSNPRLAPIFIG